MELENEEIDQILNSLSDRPYKDVSGLVSKIKIQRELQDTLESCDLKSDIQILLG